METTPKTVQHREKTNKEKPDEINEDATKDGGMPTWGQKDATEQHTAGSEKSNTTDEQLRKEPEQKDKEGLALTLEVTFTMKPANKKTNTDKDEDKEAGELENEETDSEKGEEVKGTTENHRL